jgi:hypothetical protein
MTTTITTTTTTTTAATATVTTTKTTTRTTTTTEPTDDEDDEDGQATATKRGGDDDDDAGQMTDNDKNDDDDRNAHGARAAETVEHVGEGSEHGAGGHLAAGAGRENHLAELDLFTVQLERQRAALQASTRRPVYARRWLRCEANASERHAAHGNTTRWRGAWASHAERRRHATPSNQALRSGVPGTAQERRQTRKCGDVGDAAPAGTCR